MQQHHEKLNYVKHGKLGQQEGGFHIHAVGQLLFAEAGLIHIEYSDRNILLPMQFCSWIPPFKPHRIWSTASDDYVRAIYFESHFCKNKIFLEDSVFPLSKVLKEMIRYTVKWDCTVSESIYETTFLTVIRQMLPDEMAHFIKLEIPRTDHPQLRPILDYIGEHVHQDIRIRELEYLFGISGRTLHRLFTKELGQSFSAYLMFYRLLKAIELLSEGIQNVKTVAYAVGYNSIPSFCRMFKLVTGQNPQQFIPTKKPIIK